MGSLDLDNPGCDITIDHPPARSHSFHALESAAAALAALQQPGSKHSDVLPEGRPARSRKTSLLVAAQLPLGLKLCSNCREVKAHALYHACKAKRDGLQDRCKACRAELDKQRLQQARSNSAAAAASGNNTARVKTWNPTRSGSAPTSYISSGGSIKRRSQKSSSGGSGDQVCSIPPSEATAAVAAADATATAPDTTTAAFFMREDRPVKRRRYPHWHLPPEVKGSLWSPPPLQSLPELPTSVPRQRRSGLPGTHRRSSEPSPSAWQAELAAEVSQYMSPMGPGVVRTRTIGRSSLRGPLPQAHWQRDVQQPSRTSFSASTGQQMLPPEVAAQLQAYQQQQTLQEAQQAIQAAERVRLQQLQAQHLAAAAAAKQAEEETMKAQHLQHLVTEQHRQRSLVAVAALAQMQCGRRLLVAALLADADLSKAHLCRSFVASLGAPILASILVDACKSSPYRQLQPRSNGLHPSCSAPSHPSASTLWHSGSLTKQYTSEMQHNGEMAPLRHQMMQELRPSAVTPSQPIGVLSRGSSSTETHVAHHSGNRQQQQPRQQQEQQRFLQHKLQPLQAALEQLPHLQPQAILEALQWQAHNPQVSFQGSIKSL